MKFVKLFVAVSILGILSALLLYSMRYEIARLKEGLPGFTHALGDEYFEMVKMNDGVLLSTSIHLPDSVAPFPTVLIRSPYARFEAVLRDQVCGRFVRYGYACVFQDTRGQGDSEGVWDPGTNEVEDGRDTLTWLVGQDFQNGKIAMMGPSYLTLNQYAAAAGGLPKEVKTFVPSVFAADMRDALYADGMFRHETFTAWASMNRTSNTAFQGTGKDYQAAIRHYPHEEVDTEIFKIEMPWYQRMIDIEQSENAFYGEELGRLISETPEQLKVPVLMIGGWYDVFTGPQIKDWNRLSTQSISRFVLGPWTHAGSAGSAFELNNAGGGLFQWREMLEWFSHHLKGEELKSRLGVNVYVMGKNEWRHYDEWPAKTESAIYSLSHEIDLGDCSVHDLVSFSKQIWYRTVTVARIEGVDLPRNKPVWIALTYIYGIGRTSARAIVEQVGIDPMQRVAQLTDTDVARIREAIQQTYTVEGELRKEVSLNIKRLSDLGAVRGVRHRRGLPVRGQRTHTNARTRKGPRRAIAGKKK